jgi:hypothetical protein
MTVTLLDGQPRCDLRATQLLPQFHQQSSREFFVHTGSQSGFYAICLKPRQKSSSKAAGKG